MPLEKKDIEDIVVEALKETMIFLVAVHATKGGLIQVYIDHPAGVSLDDCVWLHRRLEELFDRDKGDFELQVSSPGLGQPIRVFPQYLKALGQRLDILLEEGEGIRGILLDAWQGKPGEPDALLVQPAGTKRKPAPQESVCIPLDRIRTARVEIDFKQV